MVNAPTPATPASVAASAAAATAATADGGSAEVRRAQPRAAGAVAEKSTIPLLLDPAAIASLGRAVATVRGRARRVGVPGWAPAASTTSTSGSAPTSRSALSFLSDPKLSIEEKLMRLLAYLSDRWEKEMKSKMDQIAAGEGDTAGSKKSTSTKKKSGILGTIASAISSVPGVSGVFDVLEIPGVKAVLGKIGGPVLAAAASALGLPAAAPLLLKYGPALVDAAAGVASASGSSASSSTSMSDGKRQQLVMEIQRLYEKQKEMFGLVSNILRTSHDTRMTAINNIR